MTQRIESAVEFAYGTGRIQALLSRPADERSRPESGWPLLLFLHGAGERGTDLEQVAVHGPVKEVRRGLTLPMVVVAPQCPLGQWWNFDALSELADQLVRDDSLDPKRLYLTGLSMGGYGTWGLLARRPALFAAAIPICGGGNPKKADRIANTPLWVFHGEQDDVIPVSESEAMVRAVRDAGGRVEWTVYPNVSHDSWSATYEAQATYDWLLSHPQGPDAK